MNRSKIIVKNSLITLLIFSSLMLGVPVVNAQEETPPDYDSRFTAAELEILAALEGRELESFFTSGEIEVLAALEERESESFFTSGEIEVLAALEEAEVGGYALFPDADLDDAELDWRRPLSKELEITGFVDLGWIYPGFLADHPEDLDHHYIETGNAQFTLNKLEARSFTVNEVDIDFNVRYDDSIRGKASLFIYPTTRTNSLAELSPLTQDQDIPRDAGPDGVFGTADDIIGEDTAIDSRDGINRVVVGVKQAYLDLAYPGDLKAFLRIGKMPSLLGIEQEVFQSPYLATVAPSVIGVFSYGYPQGVQLRGAMLDDELEFGLGFTHDPNNFGNIYPGDDTRNHPFALANDNFALAGRLAFSHGTRNRFTLGVSGQVGEKGAKGSVNDGSFSSFHPFIKLRIDPLNTPHIGPFRIRTEGVVMNIENRRSTHPNQASRKTEKYDFLFTPKNDFVLGDGDRDGDDVEHQGFYVYLHTDLFRERLTLTVGYSFLNSDVIGTTGSSLSSSGRFLEWGARRTQVALRYRLRDEVVFKAEFQKNEEKGKEKVVDNDVLATSLVYSF